MTNFSINQISKNICYPIFFKNHRSLTSIVRNLPLKQDTLDDNPLIKLHYIDQASSSLFIIVSICFLDTCQHGCFDEKILR